MSNPISRLNAPAGLVVLMVVQVICAVFFLLDATEDYMARGGLHALDLHLVLESLATLTLLIAIAFEARFLRDLLQRKARLERHLELARSEVHEVIIATFDQWKLSPSEADIAMFLVKGMGTQDIATLRGSAEGTIKAHFNSIFRKAGVHSRAELLSLLIDQLLPDGDKQPAPALSEAE